MLTQASVSREELRYSSTIYQLLAGAKEPRTAVAKARETWNGEYADLRSILRAAGAFARNNDGYFIRYEKSEEKEEPEDLPPATHLLVFPVPVEPRMRVAYSYMQGLLLKYLYVEHRAIPREVRQGSAELVSKDPLPVADQIWTEFLKSGVAESAIAVSASNWTSGSNIGKQTVDDAFISESYLLGLAGAISASSSAFQWQGGDQIPAFRRKDLGELADREILKTRDDPEATEFRTNNRSKEWSTLQVYEWLENKAGEVTEFKELVEESLKAIRDERDGVELSLLPASEKLEAVFREEFVPRSSRPDWTALAIPKIMLHLLLWALVDRFTLPESGKATFMGWDLAYLRELRESFDSSTLRGSLKFMDKNDPKRGTKTLVKFVGYDKLKAEIRLAPAETLGVSSAPFELWSLREPQTSDMSVESVGRVCTVCGKTGELSEASVLPESKKRHYDNPQANKPAEVCARCVQVWSLAPISTADDSYSIVEVPVENFLELFALYESLEGINRLETLKTLNKVSSLSVFPNKYLLLSRSSGKGKMPQVAQYYLQLSHQRHFLERLKEEADLEVIAAQDRAKLAPELALTLSVLRRLPLHYATSSDDKVPAMSIINALDRGCPYEALYVAAAQAHEAGRGEMQTISGGVKDYDQIVEKFGEFYSGKQKGAIVDKKMFREIQEFSNYLDSIIRPLVWDEVDRSNSGVNGIARKYTEHIRTDFVQGKPNKLLYKISSYVESVERKDLQENLWKGVSLKSKARERVQGVDSGQTKEEQNLSGLRLEEEYENYLKEYSDNERAWKTFLEEVERRTLALILLNVRNTRRQS